jgi:hypothetical protein
MFPLFFLVVITLIFLYTIEFKLLDLFKYKHLTDLEYHKKTTRLTKMKCKNSKARETKGVVNPYLERKKASKDNKKKKIIFLLLLPGSDSCKKKRVDRGKFGGWSESGENCGSAIWKGGKKRGNGKQRR